MPKPAGACRRTTRRRPVSQPLARRSRRHRRMRAAPDSCRDGCGACALFGVVRPSPTASRRCRRGDGERAVRPAPWFLAAPANSFAPPVTLAPRALSRRARMPPCHRMSGPSSAIAAGRRLAPHAPPPPHTPRPPQSTASLALALGDSSERRRSWFGFERERECSASVTSFHEDAGGVARGFCGARCEAALGLSPRCSEDAAIQGCRYGCRTCTSRQRSAYGGNISRARVEDRLGDAKTWLFAGEVRRLEHARARGRRAVPPQFLAPRSPNSRTSATSTSTQRHSSPG